MTTSWTGYGSVAVLALVAGCGGKALSAGGGGAAVEAGDAGEAGGGGGGFRGGTRGGADRARDRRGARPDDPRQWVVRLHGRPRAAIAHERNRRCRVREPRDLHTGRARREPRGVIVTGGDEQDHPD